MTKTLPSRRSLLRSLCAAALIGVAIDTRAAAMLFRDEADGKGAWHPLNLAEARYLTIPAQVNGVPLMAMIDSGATRSVIKDKIALDLQLPYLGATLARAFTGDVSGSLYRVDNLQIDGASFSHIDVASYDVSQIEIVADNVPFVIGADLLRRVALEIQFTKDRARFVSRQAAAPSDHSKLELVGVDRAFPALPILLEHRVHDQAIVDLGSSVPLSISRDFAIQSDLLKGRTLSTTMTAGVEGLEVCQIYTLGEARIGGFTLRNIPTCVIENWQLDRPINIGWPLFAAFDAIFNLGKDALWLKPDPDRLDQPFPKDRSGLGGQRRADNILVRHVAYNSPAWHAGLREGDDIVAINGRAIDQTYPPRGERMGLKPAGTEIQVHLADNRDVMFTLADYF